MLCLPRHSAPPPQPLSRLVLLRHCPSEPKPPSIADSGESAIPTGSSCLIVGDQRRPAGGVSGSMRTNSAADLVSLLFCPYSLCPHTRMPSSPRKPALVASWRRVDLYDTFPSPRSSQLVHDGTFCQEVVPSTNVSPRPALHGSSLSLPEPRGRSASVPPLLHHQQTPITTMMMGTTECYKSGGGGG